MSDLPLACTLDPARMPQRGGEIHALGGDGLIDVTRGERAVTLRFRRDPGIRARVERLVAAEAECCAFLAFELADRDDAIVLTITAPVGAEPGVQALADLFVT